MMQRQSLTGLANTRIDKGPQRQQLLERKIGIPCKALQLSITELTLTLIRIYKNLMETIGKILKQVGVKDFCPSNQRLQIGVAVNHPCLSK